MNDKRLLPLEKHLQDLARDPHKFPDRTVDYFARYLMIKDHVDRTFFRNAGAGLAAQDGNLYTHHDAQHVDDVIESAGRLLGVNATRDVPENLKPYTKLNPYEVYAALVAILFHDAGNAQGRKDHEQRAPQYLAELTPLLVGIGSLEMRYLGDIAKAHGGRTSTKSKDTIGALKESVVRLGNDVELRAPLVAGIVRFADELSESPTRANEIALRKPYSHPKAVVHHLYSKLVQVNIDLPARTVALRYSVPVEYLVEKFELKDEPDTYLIDYIANRLVKCDRERRYCQRFFREVLAIDGIRARVEFQDGYDTVDEVLAAELREDGYPDEPCDVRVRLPTFDGAELSKLTAKYSHAEEK